MQQSNRKREREREMMITTTTIREQSNRVRDDNEDELTMMTFTQLSKTEYSDQKENMTATATYQRNN